MKNNKQLSKEEQRIYKKGFRNGIIGAITVMVVVLLLPMGIRYGVNKRKASSYQMLLNAGTKHKLQSISDILQTSYYKDVDAKKMREHLFQSLFSDLDSYSEYYNKESFQRYSLNNLEGKFTGIGVSLQQRKDRSLVVQTVFPKTPAEQVGIRSGDVFVKAGGFRVKKTSLEELVSRLQGKEGTQIKITLYRPSTKKKLSVTVTRKKIVSQTVTGRMQTDQIGYVAISEFTEHTSEQLKEHLSDLKKHGMKKLIIDLRDNGGGVLTASTDCLNQILPKGLLVYTQDKQGKKEYYRSTDKESLSIPIVVLVNKNTASASEIFAGALKDRKAAAIMGTVTYGKGIVQSVIELSDGSGFKYTTARYFTPNGVCIHEKGIQPDITVKKKPLVQAVKYLESKKAAS